MKKKTKEGIFLLSFIAIPLLAGYISSQLSGGSMPETYTQLYRPDFFPPSWVFAPVWTVLYILMGISVYLIWKLRKSENVKLPLTLFSIQLALNLLWSPIFFGLHQYFWAFIEILAMFIMIILTVLSFNKKSKAAAYLLVPYLFWVSFATVLNYVVFRTN